METVTGFFDQSNGIIYGIMAINLVLDTNVFVSALMSRGGASFRLIMLLDSGRFEVHLSVPLVLEYESVAKRLQGERIGLSVAEIDDVIDYVCAVAHHHEISFLWRPVLKDIRDEMVLELAVNAGCDYIVTHNVRDFATANQFEVDVVTPQTMLEILEGNS